MSNSVPHELSFSWQAAYPLSSPQPPNKATLKGNTKARHGSVLLGGEAGVYGVQSQPLRHSKFKSTQNETPPCRAEGDMKSLTNKNIFTFFALSCLGKNYQASCLGKNYQAVALGLGPHSVEMCEGVGGKQRCTSVVCPTAQDGSKAALAVPKMLFSLPQARS